MHNWSGAILGLGDMNAMLPDDYRITINTKNYDNLTNMKIGYICKYCQKETPQSLVKTKEIIAPLIVSCITSQQMEICWFCSECHKRNLLSQTKLIEEKLAKPCYLKVVPDPPEKKIGFQDRSRYPTAMSRWVGNFLEELEHQLGLYRAEYINEEDQDESENENAS
jgi:hypothetical protein